MSETLQSQAFEAALIIPVPEAEVLVGDFRERFDPSAIVGVPAHITINYPFTPHFSRPAKAHVNLSTFLANFPQFSFTLSEIRSFPDVLYLAPEPEQQFLTLIESVASIFPDSPPYGGQFEKPTPHLTIAQQDKSMIPSIQMEFAKRTLQALPIKSHVKELWLMDNLSNYWTTRAVFPLKPV
ncbi:MAG: 2'-5' RNA ligase family protein [Anaerolineales bacterium]